MVDFDRHAEERYNAFEATSGPAHGGITVLDWFAGRAMEGLVSSGVRDSQSIAHYAYNYAEAMLKERQKRNASKPVVKGVTGKTYG